MGNFGNFFNSHGDSDLTAGFCCLKTVECVNHLGIFAYYNHGGFDFSYVFDKNAEGFLKKQTRSIFISQTHEEQKTMWKSAIQQGQPW